MPALSSSRHSGDNLARCQHCIHTASINRCPLQRKIAPVPGAVSEEEKNWGGGGTASVPAAQLVPTFKVLAQGRLEAQRCLCAASRP